MSVNNTGSASVQGFVGNDRVLFGIVFGVLAF